MIRMNEQAQVFMDQIQSRRRDPAKAKTIKAYRSYLDNWVLPLLGRTNLKDVENGTLKAFVAQIHPHLAPTTITAVVSLVKKIVASAVDSNGNQLYPRTWNNDFIDLPRVQEEDIHAPTIEAERVSGAIIRARVFRGYTHSLVALLAGTGLRIGEALALTNQDWDRDRAIISVKSTLVDGAIQDSPKTEAGFRQVDLNPALNIYLRDQDALYHPGRIFDLDERTAYNHLQDRAGLDTGFHAFRRFRRTHLESQNVPQGLSSYWLGHSIPGVASRYVKFANNMVARKQWAQQAGLGFELPQ